MWLEWTSSPTKGRAEELFEGVWMGNMAEEARQGAGKNNVAATATTVGMLKDASHAKQVHQQLIRRVAEMRRSAKHHNHPVSTTLDLCERDADVGKGKELLAHNVPDKRGLLLNKISLVGMRVRGGWGRMSQDQLLPLCPPAHSPPLPCGPVRGCPCCESRAREPGRSGTRGGASRRQPGSALVRLGQRRRAAAGRARASADRPLPRAERA